MPHDTVKVTDVSHFEFFESQKEMNERAKELKKHGTLFHFGGKRAKSQQMYRDLVIASIYHDQGDGGGLPWVIAW